MNNALARNFSFRSLLVFAFPTIIMMLFMSLYTMVDGVFVSRFVGTDALSAVNIVFPVISIVVAVGVMLATGGSAVIAKKMGEGKADEARENFSLIVLSGIIIGLVIEVLGLVFIHPMLRLLGANDAVYSLCYEYAFALLFFVPAGVLQMLFQTFFVTAGKPALGLIVTIIGGIANIVLDYVFIVPMQMGIMGAAVATGIGYSIPAVYGLLYFAINKKGTLYFTRPRFNGKVLLHTCSNGSSEMVTNLSTAVTTLLFNVLMMKYLGADGVAAITIVLYGQYLLTAVYLGYSIGVAPIFSYKHGRKDFGQIKLLFRNSAIFVLACSVLSFAAAFWYAGPIVKVFAPADNPVYTLAVHGFHLFAVSYLFTGTNIFASALFTAFSNGKVSAALSFLRTFVFIVAALLLLPIGIGVNGIWLAIPLAEFLGIAVSVVFLAKHRKTYGYL